jgi:hypothetical protein
MAERGEALIEGKGTIWRRKERHYNLILSVGSFLFQLPFRYYCNAKSKSHCDWRSVSHYLQLFTFQFKNLRSVKHIYKNNKIYTIYTGLVQSRLCTTDYALLTSNLVYHGSLRHLNSRAHDRRQVWASYIYCNALHEKKTPWFESASGLYRPSDRRLSAKWLPTFADRGCHVVGVTDPYGRILGFLDRSRYFSIK